MTLVRAMSDADQVAQSARICAHLAPFLQQLEQAAHQPFTARHADTVNAVPSSSIVPHRESFRVAAYLAMRRNEVSLDPLMESWLRRNLEPTSGDRHIFVPKMLPEGEFHQLFVSPLKSPAETLNPSADSFVMIFTEVLSLEDWERNYPWLHIGGTPGYDLRELRDDTLAVDVSPAPAFADPPSATAAAAVPESLAAASQRRQYLLPRSCPLDSPLLTASPSLRQRCHHSFSLMLLPGVRFDADRGARLGRGGGFYDRFLAFSDPSSTDGLDGAPSFLIGVGFDNQITARCDRGGSGAGESSGQLPVPIEPHDVRVSGVCGPSLGLVMAS